MSTPTGNSPNEEPHPLTEHTPIIIKTGGDGVLGSTNIKTEIESSMMYFIGPEPGNTWVSSQSALQGRVTELSITEGTKPPIDYLIPAKRLATATDLASIRIEYDSVQIRMWESVLPDSKDHVVLNIESDIPFNVADSKSWREATAAFPPIIRVVFMSGNETIVNYIFKDPKPTIQVNFDRDKRADG